MKPKDSDIWPGVRETESGQWQPFVHEYGNPDPILTAQAFRRQYEAAAMARHMAESERVRRRIRYEMQQTRQD